MQVLATDLEVPVLITKEEMEAKETTHWEDGVYPIWESSACVFSQSAYCFPFCVS